MSNPITGIRAKIFTLNTWRRELKLSFTSSGQFILLEGSGLY